MKKSKTDNNNSRARARVSPAPEWYVTLGCGHTVMTQNRHEFGVKCPACSITLAYPCGCKVQACGKHSWGRGEVKEVQHPVQKRKVYKESRPTRGKKRSVV